MEDRRGPPKLEEALERKAARRRGDRRDSPRVPRLLGIRELGLEVPARVYEGDISLGGVLWRADQVPLMADVEVTFRLPGHASLVKAEARVERVELRGDTFVLRATFRKLDVIAELAIARFLEQRDQLQRALHDRHERRAN